MELTREQRINGNFCCPSPSCGFDFNEVMKTPELPTPAINAVKEFLPTSRNGTTVTFCSMKNNGVSNIWHATCQMCKHEWDITEIE